MRLLWEWLRLATVEPRLYVAVQNLYTFTGFSNWDPETLGFGDPLAGIPLQVTWQPAWWMGIPANHGSRQARPCQP